MLNTARRCEKDEVWFAYAPVSFLLRYFLRICFPRSLLEGPKPLQSCCGVLGPPEFSIGHRELIKGVVLLGGETYSILELVRCGGRVTFGEKRLSKLVVSIGVFRRLLN